MSIFGIVNTGNVDAICEPLVMSFPLLFFENVWLMISLTRACASPKRTVRELTKECRQLILKRRNLARWQQKIDLDRLGFPYKDAVEVNGAAIPLQNVKVVQRYVFVAKVRDGKKLSSSLPSDMVLKSISTVLMQGLLRR